MAPDVDAGSSWCFFGPLSKTDAVKDIGHRQVYDILQSRKPRATGGELWGFRLSPYCEGRAAAIGMPISERMDGHRELCLALMVVGIEA